MDWYLHYINKLKANSEPERVQTLNLWQPVHDSKVHTESLQSKYKLQITR